MNKKLLIYCGDAPNQKALANKIAEQYPVAGIIIEQKKTASSAKVAPGLFQKVWDRLLFHSIYAAWKKLQQEYDKQFPEWPSANLLRVDSINSPEAVAFSKKIAPDLVIVSGTNLIKEPLLTIPAGIGIINLHTGLSPYVKGGPNCTNWCIANNDWHLAGNTIMWINAGIDAGNIITTETIDIRSADSLYDAHKMVMEHAHELYLKAIRYLLQVQPPYIAVDQSEFPNGKIFYTKMWTAEKRAALLRNWRNRSKVSLQPPPRTISLPDLSSK